MSSLRRALQRFFPPLAVPRGVLQAAYCTFRIVHFVAPDTGSAFRVTMLYRGGSQTRYVWKRRTAHRRLYRELLEVLRSVPRMHPDTRTVHRYHGRYHVALHGRRDSFCAFFVLDPDSTSPLVRRLRRALERL